MGLFDGIFGGSGSEKRSKGLSKQEAFAGILLGAAASDGHIADEEAQGLWTITRRMRMFEGWNDDRFGRMMNKLVGVLRKKGLRTLLHSCAEALPDQLHGTAFASSVDIVLADGVVEDEEKDFLNDLQKILDISGDEALTIVEVMIIKNKG